MTIHNETDLLALTRAEKKLSHWQKLNEKGVTVITSRDEGIIYEVAERIEFWARQCEKYRKRIENHIEEFQKVNDFWAFTEWISGIIGTIKDLIKSLNIKL
jgi:hypothetical protein